MLVFRWVLCALLLAVAGRSAYAAETPYNLWAEPCLAHLDGADAVRTELRAAIDSGDTAQLTTLVCKALGILDSERWQAQWVAWHRDTDESGCGTPEQVVERLDALRRAGLGYTIAYFADAAYDTTSIDLFERAVIPELKG